MNDRDLIAEYTRVRICGFATHIDVALVNRPGPPQGQPSLKWKLYRTWQKPPTPTRVYEARAKAITDTRFFRVCVRCHLRHPRGHMSTRALCQPCAQQFSSETSHPQI